MEFQFGDLVHVKGWEPLGIVVKVDLKKRLYQCQLDNKGDVVRWFTEEDVY